MSYFNDQFPKHVLQSRPTPKRTYVVTPAVLTPLVRGKSYTQVAPSVSPQMVSPKAAGGLKPKDQRKKRRNPLTVRLSEPELDTIRAKAKAAGCSLNGYIRAAVLGADYKPPIHPELRQALLKANLELTRQGNNLNQIARYLNGGLVLPTEGNELLGSISHSMLQTHAVIRDALTKGKLEEA